MIGFAIDMFRHPFQKEYSYDRHKDVMKKLKFISKIEPGDRINVNSISTASNSWFSAIYRSIFKESRAKTYQFLNDVVDRSFELIVLYQDSDKMADRITCSHILEDLHHSIGGLKNLQTTYTEDRSFYCDIDTLIGSIFARLAECYQNDKLFMTDEQRKRLHHILFPNNDPIKKTEAAEVIEDKSVMENKPQKMCSTPVSIPNSMGSQRSVPLSSEVTPNPTPTGSPTEDNSVSANEDRRESHKDRQKQKHNHMNAHKP